MREVIVIPQIKPWHFDYRKLQQIVVSTIYCTWNIENGNKCIIAAIICVIYAKAALMFMTDNWICFSHTLYVMADLKVTNLAL